jgi:hypothetical protein
LTWQALLTVDGKHFSMNILWFHTSIVSCRMSSIATLVMLPSSGDSLRRLIQTCSTPHQFVTYLLTYLRIFLTLHISRWRWR